MKKLFCILLAILLAWSLSVYLLQPEHQTGKPVIYWVTDNNPARVLQIERFHEWLRENNYPDIELRLDTSNADLSKKIIQGVSGVASDIIDLNPDTAAFFVKMGLLHSLDEEASAMDFGTDKTYASLRESLIVNDKQYIYPCNVSVASLVVNRANFERIGMPPPPERWTIEEFEAIGKEYVKRANDGLERQVNFFSQSPSRIPLLRSMGDSYFNETLTRCTLDESSYADVLSLLYKWTYEDHLLPSEADLASASTDSGYGGQSLQLLNNGNYGMAYIGRYAIIQLRQFGELDLDVSEVPNGGFPNSLITTRAAGIYSGSKHPELAAYFLKFLASEDYSELIVIDGDALPPNPHSTQTEAFLRPSKYRNEHDFHEPFPRFAESIAIPQSISPFVLPQTVMRTEKDAYEACMAGLLTPQEAAQQTAERINEEIDRTLKEHPTLQAEYDRRVKLQEQIDERKAAGQPIPEAWIFNPFYKAYYKATGQLEGVKDV